MLLHVGLDDTDSKLGGCTTYIAYNIIKKLTKKGERLLDYPRLLRLNPNVPWKTRGNGAVGFTVETEDPAPLIDLVYSELEEASREYGSAPAFVLLTDHERTRLHQIFEQAVYRILALDVVDKVLEKNLLLYSSSYKRKHGLIGSIAAAANLLDHGDHTFEILVYRRPEFMGQPRYIDRESVKRMDAAYSNYTFNNIDDERILITPHGKDPVLFGIRGEDPFKLLEAAKTIKCEPPLGGLVFKTNQGTDAHYKEYDSLSQVRLGDSVKLRLKVAEHPTITLGGHVFLKLTDGKYSIKAAFYWETGDLRKAAARLVPEDCVTIYGGLKVSSEPVINVEKLLINALVPLYIEKNPLCPKCLSPSESMGKSKGFRCKKCKTPIAQGKNKQRINRQILPGLYMPPLRYFRHLMKPLKRYGKEKAGYNFTHNTYKLVF